MSIETRENTQENDTKVICIFDENKEFIEDKILRVFQTYLEKNY